MFLKSCKSPPYWCFILKPQTFWKRMHFFSLSTRLVAGGRSRSGLEARDTGCLSSKRAFTHVHSALGASYLQSRNKWCWWNYHDPRTPAAAGHLHRQRRAATLAPDCRSPRSPPGSGRWGGTEHSIWRTDEGAPSELLPGASPHSTLWQKWTSCTY